jgi:hypothetical protein
MVVVTSGYFAGRSVAGGWGVRVGGARKIRL